MPVRNALGPDYPDISILSIGGGVDPDAGQCDGTVIVSERTQCKFTFNFLDFKLFDN